MEHAELAKRSQDAITGGNVNYYLQIILGKDGQEIVVEIEDIIEVLEMLFSAGNVFKAIVRICKLRMDLGKPGSNPSYESGKAVYYSERTAAISQRKLKLGFFRLKIHTALSRFLIANTNKDVRQLLPTTIEIKDPKRLSPYSFVIDDFIESLNPTRNEAAALRGIIMVSLARIIPHVPIEYEVEWANQTLSFARAVDAAEKLKVKKK